MDSSYLLQHPNNHHSSSAGVNFGGPASVLARLGRPIPGPFAHFASPIAPENVSSLVHSYDFHTSHHFHSLAAAATAYSIDSLLHAGANANGSSANLIASLASSSLNNHSLHRRDTPDSNIRFIEAKKALTRPWSRSRSPGQPLKCPLCLISLEGSDITSHFVEEVHQMETLRKLNDWETKENLSSDCENKSNSMETEEGYKTTRFYDKMQLCTRWQTYQRVKQNRHTRISATRNKRYSEEQEKYTETLNSKPMNQKIWRIAVDIEEPKEMNKDVEIKSSEISEDDFEKKSLRQEENGFNCTDSSETNENIEVDCT